MNMSKYYHNMRAMTRRIERSSTASVQCTVNSEQLMCPLRGRIRLYVDVVSSFICSFYAPLSFSG